MFHGYSIALVLLRILLSIISILFISDRKNLSDSPNSQSSQVLTRLSTEKQSEELDDGWEIATEEYTQSGNFEVAA